MMEEMFEAMRWKKNGSWHFGHIVLDTLGLLAGIFLLYAWLSL